MARKKTLDFESETFEPDFVDPYATEVKNEDTEEDATSSFCSKCGCEFPSYQAKVENDEAICEDCAGLLLETAAEQNKSLMPEIEIDSPLSQLPEGMSMLKAEEPELKQQADAKNEQAISHEDKDIYKADIKTYDYGDLKKTAKPNGNGKRHIDMGGFFSSLLEGATKTLLGSSFTDNASVERLLDSSSEYPISLFSGELGKEYAKMPFGDRQKIAYGFAFLKKVDDDRFTLADIVSRLETKNKIKALKTLFFSAPTMKAGEESYPALSHDRAYEIIEKIYKENKEQ